MPLVKAIYVGSNEKIEKITKASLNFANKIFLPMSTIPPIFGLFVNHFFMNFTDASLQLMFVAW